MARLFSHSLIFGLVALIFSISAPAFAQHDHTQDRSLPCNRIRECNSLYQVYELAAAGCRAEFKAYKCGEADSRTDYGKLLRSCTPERMCEEAQIFNIAYSAIPGCTGGVQKYAGEVLDGAKACQRAGAYECGKAFVPLFLHNLFIAPFEAIWNFGKEIVGIAREPKIQENKKNIERGWACFNTEGRFKMMCEGIGGTFSRVAMGRMLMAGGRAGLGRLIDEPAPVVARRAQVVDRARAEIGARPLKAKAAIEKVRAAARTPVVVAAANEFVSPSKPAPAPAPKKATRTIADTRRDEYMERLIGRQNTTVEQRRAFQELAFRAEAKGDTIFLDIQNSKMKYMNDHLKDKNLVTAVTNARIKLMFDELRAKYPTIKANKLEYDDFKSGRFGFEFTDGKIPPGFMEDLRASMKKAEDNFIAELGEFEVVPKGSDLLPAEKWFSCGTGFTPDEANLACRYAARTGESVVDFRSTRVMDQLGRRLTQAETVRSGAAPILERAKLMETVNGKRVPRLEVFEAFRKSSSPEQFVKKVKESTGATLTNQTAVSIMNYLKSVDEWSTGLLLVEERQSVTFAGSKYNGLTIDISGMGALNLRDLAAALAGEKTVAGAMPKARAAERSATRTFEANKKAIMDSVQASLRERSIAAEVRASGDDIIVIPTNKAFDQDALSSLHRAIATSSSSSNVRISAVSTGVRAADEIAVQGESLEKAVRGATAGTVQNQNAYTMMVTSSADGKPRLQIEARDGSVVPQTIQDVYQNAFREELARK